MKGANIVVAQQERCPLMVEVGDRIRLSSMKGADREGVVTAVTGSLMRVRWLSGEETTVVPAPGTVSVLAAGRAGPQKRAKKSAAKKAAGATKRNSGSRSAPPKKDGAE
jgi:hypothetical protein